DIPLLAQHFLKKFTIENQKEITGFSPEATDFLLKYEWPGNVRELENTIERAVILAQNPSIKMADMSQENMPLARSAPVRGNLKEIEKNYILETLIQSQGNYRQTASSSTTNIGFISLPPFLIS
ncbi:unnamed protein product, partial [marine sediment metagenome]